MEYKIHQDPIPKHTSTAQDLLNSPKPVPFTYPSLSSHFPEPSISSASYIPSYSYQMPNTYLNNFSQPSASNIFATTQTTCKTVDKERLHQYHTSRTSLTEVEWGSVSQKVICPFCNEETETKVQTSRTGKAWCMCCAMCAVGLWPCCLIPLYCKQMKAIVHKCPHCHIVLGRYAE